MTDAPDQNAYEAACIAHIQNVFAEQGIGNPSQVSLLRKYTSDGYLFFVGFAHFEEGLAGTPAAHRFRTDLELQSQSRMVLPGGHYWLVRPYRPRSAPNSTLEQQERLLKPAAPAPKARPPKRRRSISHFPQSRSRDGDGLWPIPVVGRARQRAAALSSSTPRTKHHRLTFPPTNWSGTHTRRPTKPTTRDTTTHTRSHPRASLPGWPNRLQP